MLASARLLDVVAQATPNPAAHRFLTTVELLPEGALELHRGEDHAPSLLLDALLAIEGVRSLYVAGHFVTVTKAATHEWFELLPQLRQALLDVLGQNEGPLALVAPTPVTEAPEAEHEPGLQEWFRTRILPATESDGGAIFFEGVADGQLRLQARGACASCPHLATTVQKGILGPLRQSRPDLVGAMVRAEGELRQFAAG
jgi:NFU1 iron-sulfur cluster scaffold homolog, mitochondrial